MRLLVTFRTTSVRGRELAGWAEDGFAAAGWTVSRVDLDAVAGRSALAAQFTGLDLVAFATDRVVFADGGGPDLRRVARWAEAAAVPVIALAEQVEISTRELRTLGVETAYQIDSAAAVGRVVANWTPR